MKPHHNTITIITPTHNRPTHIIQRTINSILQQTHPHWTQILISDGKPEPHAQKLAQQDPRIHYTHSKKHGNHGNHARQEALQQATGQYTTFLDDDNIIYPTYLQKMLHAIKTTNTHFAICQILHLGPLSHHHPPPPTILTGKPKTQHIDTLQIMIKTTAIKHTGWQTTGYLADGITIQKLAQNYTHTHIPETLCAHL